MADQPLHPFELEIKKKLASGASPFDELAEKEGDDLDRKTVRSARKKLALLVKKGPLTAKQRLFYDLLYVKNMSTREIAQQMLVSHVTVRRYRQKIQMALSRGAKGELQRGQVLKGIFGARLTRKQRLICKLRYREKLKVQEIVQRLGVSETAVYKLLKRVSKKSLPIKMSSKCERTP